MVERKVLTEIIQLYRDLPCLWDLSCEAYKDKNQKSVGWGTLVKKWREIEPDTNVVSIKKRMDNLKSSYKREAKKVKESKKQNGAAANEVYRPNLWYFNMMTFLDKEYEQLRSGFNTSSSVDESSQEHQVGKKRRHSLLQTNKRNVVETEPDLLIQKSQKKINTFGVYVGEQLDSLSVHQRQIAEKLISEIIFLAKTENLNFNSGVETSNKPRPMFLNNCSPGLPSPHYSSSPQYYSPVRQFNSPSPQNVSLSASPQIVIKTELSPQYDSSLSSSSSLYIQETSPPPDIKPCQSPVATDAPLTPYFRTTQSIPTSLSHIQTKNISQFQPLPTRSHPSSAQHESTMIPSKFQRSTPSPTLLQVIQPSEVTTQNIIVAPTGSLLKELLI